MLLGGGDGAGVEAPAGTYRDRPLDRPDKGGDPAARPVPRPRARAMKGVLRARPDCGHEKAMRFGDISTDGVQCAAPAQEGPPMSIDERTAALLARARSNDPA